MKNLKIFAGEIPALSADQEGLLRGGFAMLASDNRDIDNYCKNVCQDGPPSGTNDCVNDCAAHCTPVPSPTPKPSTPSSSSTWLVGQSAGIGMANLF